MSDQISSDSCLPLSFGNQYRIEVSRTDIVDRFRGDKRTEKNV